MTDQLSSYLRHPATQVGRAVPSAPDKRAPARIAASLPRFPGAPAPSSILHPLFSALARPLSLGLALLLAALLLPGCHSPAPAHSLQRFQFKHPAMGTLFTLTFYAPDPASADAAARAAWQRVDALEDVMSDYQADSELMQLCDRPAGKPVPVSADLFDILQQGQKIAQLSDGAFDITVGPYVRLWRFSRKRLVLPTPEELAKARAVVGWRKLHLDPHARTATLLVPNMRLDLGGLGKGYTADQVLKLLKARGITRALVAASGDIAIGDAPPGEPGWKVGISPMDARHDEVARTLVLHNAGVSTSGDTEQFITIGGVRYSHILDPTTGLGLTNRIQATVVAPNATITDSFDTTLCILGPKQGLALADSLPGTAALIIVRDGEATRSFTSRRFSRLTQVR